MLPSEPAPDPEPQLAESNEFALPALFSAEVFWLFEDGPEPDTWPLLLEP